MYRCQAVSVAGFIQQLAVSYLRHGYVFYVTGYVPAKKDPHAVDHKLIELYGIDVSKWTRARRKRSGLASMQYIRHERFFVLLATRGEHLFFERELEAIRDARRAPIRYAGYSVSVRAGHPHVRIDQDEYNRLKSYLLELAMKRAVSDLAGELAGLQYEPYAPVRRQLLNLLRAVNRVRKTAGLGEVPIECLRLRRRPTLPFG